MKSIYDEDYIEIITRLRIIRTSKNITQLDLANKMGKTQSFVSKIESCERRLDVIEFLRWLDTLNISFSDVIPVSYTHLISISPANVYSCIVSFLHARKVF